MMKRRFPERIDILDESNRHLATLPLHIDEFEYVFNAVQIAAYPQVTVVPAAKDVMMRVAEKLIPQLQIERDTRVKNGE